MKPNELKELISNRIKYLMTELKDVKENEMPRYQHVIELTYMIDLDMSLESMGDGDEELETMNESDLLENVFAGAQESFTKNISEILSDIEESTRTQIAVQAK